MQCRESCDAPPCCEGGGKNPKERAMHLRDQCQGIKVMEGLENRGRGLKTMETKSQTGLHISSSNNNTQKGQERS